MASRARNLKKMNKSRPFVPPAAAWRPYSRDIAITYIEGIAARLFKFIPGLGRSGAPGSGAAQDSEARGTGTLPRQPRRARSEIFKSHYPQANVETKLETQTYGWRGDKKDERESRGCEGRIWLIGDCAAAASAVVASCPMLHGDGFLPNAARGAAVAACLLRCHLSSNALRTDSKG